MQQPTIIKFDMPSFTDSGWHVAGGKHRRVLAPNEFVVRCRRLRHFPNPDRAASSVMQRALLQLLPFRTGQFERHDHFLADGQDYAMLRMALFGTVWSSDFTDMSVTCLCLSVVDNRQTRSKDMFGNKLQKNFGHKRSNMPSYSLSSPP